MAVESADLFMLQRGGVLYKAPISELPGPAALGAAMLAGVAPFTAAQSITPIALTDGASIATDASLSNIFTVTIAGDRILASPTGLVAGGTYVWHVTQDATGGRLLAYGAAFLFPGGVAPTLDAAPGSKNLITATTPDGVSLFTQYIGVFS